MNAPLLPQCSSNLEVPAPVEGTVAELLVQVGDKLEVGQTIVRLDAGQTPAPAPSDVGEPVEAAPEPVAPEPAPVEVGPAPEETQKRGLFGKKKKK